jgi:hypothetical protein
MGCTCDVGASVSHSNHISPLHTTVNDEDVCYLDCIRSVRSSQSIGFVGIDGI